jgi:hypothetical protein
MQQPSFFRFFQVDFFPLGNAGPLGPVAAPAPRQPILQNSRLVVEHKLIFFAFCADVEAYLRLMECPIHSWFPLVCGNTEKLIVPKRFHGINRRGVAGGNVAGEKRHSDQEG